PRGRVQPRAGRCSSLVSQFPAQRIDGSRPQLAHGLTGSPHALGHRLEGQFLEVAILDNPSVILRQLVDRCEQPGRLLPPRSLNYGPSSPAGALVPGPTLPQRLQPAPSAPAAVRFVPGDRPPPTTKE